MTQDSLSCTMLTTSLSVPKTAIYQWSLQLAQTRMARSYYGMTFFFHGRLLWLLRWIQQAIINENENLGAMRPLGTFVMLHTCMGATSDQNRFFLIG